MDNAQILSAEHFENFEPHARRNARHGEGWYEDLLRAARTFLQEPVTSPQRLGQSMLLSREDVLELITAVDEASGGDGDEVRIKKQVAACMADDALICEMSLSTMLAVIENSRDPPVIVKDLKRITIQQIEDETDTKAELDYGDHILDSAFARLVGDGGVIDFKALSISLKSSGANHGEVEEVMARFDSNGDNVIDGDEFQRMVSTLWSEEDTNSALKKWSKTLVDYQDLQKRSQKWLEQVVAEMMSKAPVQSEPHVIVPYGPPGCGKSGATNLALKEYDIRKEDCVEPNIDDLVRSYMQDVTNNEHMFGDQPTYFAVRSGWPSMATCKMMEVAIETKRNMIVETTGRSTWLAQNVLAPAAKSGFRTIIVYVLVPLVKIAPRALARKRRTGQGHPPFIELSETSVQAARNLATFQDAAGSKATVLFANNAGPYGTLRLMKMMDPGLDAMALEEPFQIEIRAMLAQQARGKPYTLDQILEDLGMKTSSSQEGSFFQGLLLGFGVFACFTPTCNCQIQQD